MEERVVKEIPAVSYWSRVLDLEIFCFQFVRAFRKADFSLYVQALTQIVPWMFAMNLPIYSRWLSVHIHNMTELPVKHPEVFQQFSNGSFVVHKMQILFSSIALDHAHEQVNAMVKGDGGVVGLTESREALRRWMIAGPEVARMVQEFEEMTSSPEDHNHHEQKQGIQRAFAENVTSVVSTFEDLGNPFTENSQDLWAIHTRDVMDDSVVTTVQNVIELKETQFLTLFRERFIDRSKPISDTIKNSNLATFAISHKKTVSKDKAKVVSLKEDSALFSRLYIACQIRDGILGESSEESCARQERLWSKAKGYASNTEPL